MTSARFIAEIPQHASDREGTLVDVRHALERLMHVSTTVFDRIESRIDEESAKLEQLDERISTIKQKIAIVAARPSHPVMLDCISRLPRQQTSTTAFNGLLSDFPIQKLGEVESDEYRFKNRKNVDEDEDPVVPRDALIDLDRRLGNNVALRVRDVLEQSRHDVTEFRAQINGQHSWYWPSTGLNGGMTFNDDEDEVLGPAPPSLQDLGRANFQASIISPEEVATTVGADVAYKPRTKEAHQLGLPTSLGGLLPDIAEPAKIFMVTNRSNAPKASTATTTAVSSRPVSKTNAMERSNEASSNGIPDQATVGSAIDTETASVAPQDEPQPKNTVVSSVTGEIRTEARGMVNAASEQQSEPTTLSPGLRTESEMPPRDLLSAIRQGASLKTTKGKTPQSSSKPSKGGDSSSPSKSKRPVSLADEMREKLARRQKALSGERDEEEQLAERRRKGREEQWDEQSSDSGSSAPSVKSALKAGKKRGRDPAPPAMAFAGLDALLNRELAKKGSIVSKPPPKPASTAGDWDDD